MSALSLRTYIMQSILPRCNLIYGDSLASVYLQIVSHINHEDNVADWKKDACWLSNQTLATYTRLTTRTLRRHLDTLISLGMIEEIWHNKLRTFRLRNHAINNQNELRSWIRILENQLFRDSKRYSKEYLQQHFKELDESSAAEFTKLLWWENGRESLVIAEQIYKGSSMFMLNILQKHNTLSESKRSLLLGCSQSTLSRYIKAYENADILQTTQDSAFSIKRLEIVQNKNEMGVVIDMEQQEPYICPLCNSKHETPKALSMHLSKMKDPAHNMLNQLRKVKKCKPNELYDVYFQYRKQLKALMKNSDVKVEEFIEEANKEASEKKLEKPKIKADNTNSTAEAFAELDVPPKKKRKQNPDTAPALLKFFYEKTGGQSMNIPKECKQIKNLLASKANPLTPDQVRIVLSYMARRGNTDLRFLTNSVQDALLEQKYLNELDTIGTPAYLVNKFFKGFGMEVNQQTLLRDVRYIIETINSSSYEETEQTIDYMIQIKCNILAFIGSKRTEMKTRTLTQENSAPPQQSNKVRNNPALFDQGEWVYIRDNLAGARIKLDKVPESYKARAMEEVKTIFKERRFRKGYTYLDWAWEIGMLELDNDMYALALSEEPRFHHDSAFKQWVESLRQHFAAMSV